MLFKLTLSHYLRDPITWLTALVAIVGIVFLKAFPYFSFETGGDNKNFIDISLITLLISSLTPALYQSSLAFSGSGKIKIMASVLSKPIGRNGLIGSIFSAQVGLYTMTFLTICIFCLALISLFFPGELHFLLSSSSFIFLCLTFFQGIIILSFAFLASMFLGRSGIFLAVVLFVILSSLRQNDAFFIPGLHFFQASNEILLGIVVSGDYLLKACLYSGAWALIFYLLSLRLMNFKDF